jgi:hypothetical protein
MRRALLLLVTAVAAFRMSIHGDIEHTTGQLRQYRAATRGVLMRKKQLLSGAPNVSAREHAWLNEMFCKLRANESKVQLELQELIITALMQQVNASK